MTSIHDSHDNGSCLACFSGWLSLRNVDKSAAVEPPERPGIAVKMHHALATIALLLLATGALEAQPFGVGGGDLFDAAVEDADDVALLAMTCTEQGGAASSFLAADTGGGATLDLACVHAMVPEGVVPSRDAFGAPTAVARGAAARFGALLSSPLFDCPLSGGGGGGLGADCVGELGAVVLAAAFSRPPDAAAGAAHFSGAQARLQEALGERCGARLRTLECVRAWQKWTVRVGLSLGRADGGGGGADDEAVAWTRQLVEWLQVSSRDSRV